MSRKAPNPPRSGPRPAPPPPPPATSDVAKHTAWVGEIVEQWIHEMPDVAVLTRWYEQTYYRLVDLGERPVPRLHADDLRQAGNTLEIAPYGVGVIWETQVSVSEPDAPVELTVTIRMTRGAK